jgi:hypothetical protein
MLAGIGERIAARSTELWEEAAMSV